MPASMDEEKFSSEDMEGDDQSSCSSEMDLSNWAYMPEPMLLHIFQYLPAYDILAAGRTCKDWCRSSYDDLLWKNLVYRHFKIDRTVEIMPGKHAWLSEYKRLTYHTPVILTEVLDEHTHQVLHVSFAHNGKYFATCSKDGYVLVWNSGYPASIEYHKDMKVFCWKYTQFSQFNQSDTLLLVSGVHFGTPHSTSGEIAVFSLQGEFNLQCRIVNKPYDIFGTWYSDHYLLSGDLHWLAHLVSSSVLWLNKASQELSSEHVPVMNQLYKFYNCNASSIRAVMVANCLASTKGMSDKDSEDGDAGAGQPKQAKNVKGNPPSHRDMAAYPRAHSSQQDPDAQGRGFAPVDSAQHNWWKLGDGLEYASPIYYNQEYRMVETEHRGANTDGVEDGVDEAASISDGSPVDVETEAASEASEVSLENDCNSESDDVSEPNVEKLLIFTTGSQTYTPHQIGFKKIKPVAFPRRMDPGPSLGERIAQRRRDRERERDPACPGEPNWVDFPSVASRFDSIDHLIDLHGHIIGMGLSPDHRYLYVNSRPWPEGCVISNPLSPPPIAQEIDIHVIDLVTLKEVGTMLRAHKAYTPNHECFFIFLDVCNEYVASGAEDKHGYLWDRHYGICLAKYPHNDVVNSVAFNPRDPEMLVTTSDDFLIKVWRSRNRVKELEIPEAAEWPKCLEIRLKATNRNAPK